MQPQHRNKTTRTQKCHTIITLTRVSNRGLRSNCTPTINSELMHSRCVDKLNVVVSGEDVDWK